MSILNSSERTRTPLSDVSDIVEHFSEEEQLQLRNEMLEVVDYIQVIARGARTAGFRSKQLNEALDSFMESVDTFLDKISRPTLPGDRSKGLFVSLLPESRKQIGQMTKESLNIHLVGFLRTHGFVSDGSVFDTRAQHELSQSTKKARERYIEAFILQLVEHLTLVADEETNTLLARYYTPQFTYDFFYGTYIESVLNGTELSLSSEIIHELFSPHIRQRIIIHNTKSIDNAIRTIANNYIRLRDVSYVQEKIGPEWSEQDIIDFLNQVFARE